MMSDEGEIGLKDALRTSYVDFGHMCRLNYARTRYAASSRMRRSCKLKQRVNVVSRQPPSCSHYLLLETHIANQ